MSHIPYVLLLLIYQRDDTQGTPDSLRRSGGRQAMLPSPTYGQTAPPVTYYPTSEPDTSYSLPAPDTYEKAFEAYPLTPSAETSSWEVMQKLDLILMRLNDVTSVQNSITQMKYMMVKQHSIFNKQMIHETRTIKLVINKIQNVHQDLSVKLDKNMKIAARSFSNRCCKNCSTDHILRGDV